MPTYQYARVSLGGATGGFDIDHPDRTTPPDQIYLAKEIETALPGKTFTICCQGTNCDIVFDVALNTSEETTLTNTVNDHKNNV
jgi:hypothetical protein